jgi:hypothetical protein
MADDRWTREAFHDEVRGWVAEQLKAGGVVLTGGWWQPHVRPWSSAIRFGATQGAVWFKVNGPGTRQEPALLRLLQELVPGIAPEVIAVDPDRGWSLSCDAGPMLRQVAAPTEQWDAWERVLPRYADAQLAVAGHGDAARIAGVREASPQTVPGQARALLDELARRRSGGLDPNQVDRLQKMLPRLDDWCAELADSGVPSSLQHDDLHSGNVCVTGPAMRVIDWGDASWGCPLGTMLTTLRSVAHHAELPEDAAEVRRVLDAYLEAFTSYGVRADLVRWVQLASRIGCVGKALAWRAALTGSPESTSAEYDHPVRGWLLELLEPDEVLGEAAAT